MKMNGDNKMNNIKKNEKTAAPDARDFLGGNFLRKEDITEPITVTIAEVRSMDVPNAERRKLIVWFREMAKPLILNKTNTRKMVDIFQNTDTATWRGRITLYFEDTVEFGGRIVGGIRIRPEVVTDATDIRNTVRVPVVNGHHVEASDLQDEGDFYSVS